MTQKEKIEIVAMYDGWVKVGYSYLGGELLFQKKINHTFGYDNKSIDELKYITSLDWLHPVAMKVQVEILVFARDISAKAEADCNSLRLCIRKQSSIASACSRPCQNGQYLDLFESVVEAILFINQQKQKK